jgi:hypothetical protein
MEPILLDNLPFELNLDHLMKLMRVRPNSPDSRDLAALAEEAQKIARPKALYGVAYIDQKEEAEVVLDGVRLSSRVMRVNLDKAERVFPFTCTCGMELQAWGEKIDDMIWGFWAEAIKEEALRCAMGFFHDTLKTQYKTGHVSTMSPGSLADWPISQQAPLFQLLGTPKEVRLTDSMLMIPTKSVSGIVFPTDGSFESCQLCPRKDCPGRRAPYDESLYERKYCPAG